MKSIIRLRPKFLCGRSPMLMNFSWVTIYYDRNLSKYGKHSRKLKIPEEFWKSESKVIVHFKKFEDTL